MCKLIGSESMCINIIIFVSRGNIRIPEYKKVYRESENVQICRVSECVFSFATCSTIRIPAYTEGYRASEYVQIYRE